MKSKAQISGLGVAFMIGLVLLLIGFTAINFIKDSITEVRGISNLNCSGVGISDGTKLTCLLVDFVVPYLIIIIISVSGGVITAKLLM